MSEDVKSKQFFKSDDFLLYEVYYGKSEENMVPKTIEQIAAKQANEKLEPTMRLIDELAEALSTVCSHSEDCMDSDLDEKEFSENETCERDYIAIKRAKKKYKKFKDGLR